jgi:2-phosphoglycerate kinase
MNQPGMTRRRMPVAEFTPFFDSPLPMAEQLIYSMPRVFQPTAAAAMAKLLVINSEEGTQVQFLRGILTRSLQKVGLKFDDAFRIASDIRDNLSNTSKIESSALRDLVADRLRKKRGEHLAVRYLAYAEPTEVFTVRNSSGMESAFSFESHRKTLESCGLSEREAGDLTQKIYRHFVDRQREMIESAYLGRLTYRCLQRDVGSWAADRYLAWRKFSKSGVPLILLVGGAPGSGKSTIATALAARLDIFRTQSTDMLREVMRVMMPERLLPILHRSSFDAWKALPESAWLDDQEEQVASGFRGQADLIAVPCEAVMERAIRERVSLVLEGVHIDPVLIHRLPKDDDIIVVPVMLGILKQDLLRKRIRGRGGTIPHRRAERYLKNFDSIWHLQSYLLSEADKADIPIVVNDDREATLSEMLRIIVDQVSAKLKPSLDSVFPTTGEKV